MDAEPDSIADESRVWLVERTYGDDELNLIILVYATPDGDRYVRKERALTSFADDRPTRASLTVPTDELGTVTDEDDRERYAEEASRMAAEHDPDDTI
ncbi:hypothetical protein HUG10_04180 [Halorarum halophilum]|uniref:DUF7967 domain-containing protein n=1 Tax=Halorarum halophilum TaxID=2743090 RepID=A0A7D5GJU5_9EURY|nr:hypothetical protein [Halobaculum halophilum]QLG26787.1 hypothetical protein HUG10_04180 [Halobaculum halophilum]